jgi:hypothetical protein
MHAESSDAWPVDAAKQRMCKFVSDKVRRFRLLLAAGARNDAYFQLGMGLHAVMDSTSPVHRGFQTFNLLDVLNHGGNLPYLPSREDVDTAKLFRDETVAMMNRAKNGDMTGCGCQ